MAQGKGASNRAATGLGHGVKAQPEAYIGKSPGSSGTVHGQSKSIGRRGGSIGSTGSAVTKSSRKGC